jgi:PIN domain nuclease of toxin-antitoxin system
VVLGCSAGGTRLPGHHARKSAKAAKRTSDRRDTGAEAPVYVARSIPTKSARCGGYHHQDPFDRLLIAQARLDGLAVVTSDPMFARYDVPVRWAND